jgi:hypothetical protein
MPDAEEKNYNPSPIGNPSLLARRSWWQTQLVILIGKQTPKCREVTRILSRSMDEPLSLRMRFKLRMHYLICCWCQRYAAHLQQMRRFSHEFPEHICEVHGGQMPGEAKERLRNALRDAGAARPPDRDAASGRP